MTVPGPARLVCPSCRRPDAEGRLRVVLLPDDLCCPGCGTRYPSVDGIACVPPDLAGFEAAQRPGELPPWLPALPGDAGAIEACRSCAGLEPGTPDFTEALLPAIFGLALYPAPDSRESRTLGIDRNLSTLAVLRGWLDRVPLPGAPASCCLEVGCGPGGILHELAPRFPGGAIGFDLRLGLLRLAARIADAGFATLPFRVEGTRFEPVRVGPGRRPGGPIRLVQGDLSSPPFEAEVFPLVAALSVLDTVVDPLLGLGQLDALLAPGGLLLLTTPYHWEPAVTPPASWWSGPDQDGIETLRALLSGAHPALPWLAYDLLEEAEDLPWVLPGHRRLAHNFTLHAILARKRG